MIISCLFAMTTFLSTYEHSHKNEWFFYNFDEKTLIRTWVTSPKTNETINFYVVKKLNPAVYGSNRVIKKEMCIENNVPYTTITVTNK